MTEASQSQPVDLSRQASLTPDTLDPDSRTVEVVFSTGARATQMTPWGMIEEELSMDPNAVDLRAFNRGASVVTDHLPATNNVVGSIQPNSARIENGKGVATVRFAANVDDADKTFELVRQGHVRSVSIGYRVHKYEVVDRSGDREVWRAVSWEPLELSTVVVPAESGAGFRTGQPANGNQPAGGDQMNRTPDDPQHQERRQQIEHERQDLIRGLASRLGMSSDFAERAISESWSIDAVRSAIFEEKVKETSEVTHAHTRVMSGHDAVDATREAAIDALTSRLTGQDPQTASGRDMRGYSLVGMARELAWQQNDREASTLNAPQMVARAFHSTSDFPQLLEETGRRVVAEAYRVNQSPLRRVAREVDASDFRPFSRILMGEHPELEQVNEHGEFRSGSFETQSETLRLKTWGKKFSLTRQAVVNDDTSALSEWMQNMALAATALEADLLAGVLTANGGQGQTMSDGDPLHHANHNNLASAGAISVQNLSDARQLLRTMKAPGGTQPLNLEPRTLVVGSEGETDGESVLAQLQPSTVDSVNPFSSRLSLVVEPRLDPANGWWVFASPTQSAVIAMVFLDGVRAPEVESRRSFDIDGLELRIRHDVSAGALDHRGSVYTPFS